MDLEQKQRPLGRPRQNKNTKSTKETILEVATRLFLTQNYQVVSMGEVAKVCGVTKATVYYYYSTKADLFTATMTQMMIRIRENMSQILSTNKTLEERLLDFAKVYLHATMDIDMKNFMKDAKMSLSEEQLKELKNAENNMYEVLEKHSILRCTWEKFRKETLNLWLMLSYLYYQLGILKMKITILFWQI